MSESRLDSHTTTDKSMRSSEIRYRRLFEAAQDGILILNADTSEIEDAHPFLIEIIGYSHAELIGKTLWDIGAFRDTKLNKEAFDELKANRYIRYSDLPLERKDGQLVFVEFIMAWVGLADTGPDQCVRVIAHYGRDDGYLESGQITWADTQCGHGPTGRAIRSGEVQFCDDISTDPTMVPWRTEALRRGYKSSIAVPFRLPNEIMACLTLYRADCDVWSAPERKLLQEIADDISFGIRALRTEIEKIQHQVSLRDRFQHSQRHQLPMADRHDRAATSRTD